MRLSLRWLAVSCLVVTYASAAEPIPHAQDKPPGPALSPAEAVAKMTVPEGFSVEVVASEPDIVNPIAMAIDERGRFWITESLEYPRREPGKGRDRIKVLEDTDGDGKADKFTVFAEGLNIPSGIAVGGGGVWVANAPDILFLQDTDGDGKADRQEVVVTGFGREDTHELPNSLTWGPDGWLYGLNGVFNHCDVHYPKESKQYKEDHPGWEFTCALFRIHPQTREFKVWCEGTSNPWGVTWDPEGSAFISACVIDHLWHLTETGYYHRQGGPYPPHTWKIESIVKHKHQKAAYCGITYLDTDAYPAEYRDKLVMGNIHGGCLNVDKLQRDGSTYFATPEKDFLTANDAWFMPVVQKVGPDGSLYVLDWYDRYHCYQDANRDPAGIDRLKGRLYRVRYKETPHSKPFNMNDDSDEQLVERLKSGNIYDRETAQRLIVERTYNSAVPRKPGGVNAVRDTLRDLIAAKDTPHKTRMHAVFALVGAGPLDDRDYDLLLKHESPAVRAWGVRAAGNYGSSVRKDDLAKILPLAGDPSADVRLQVLIAAKKLNGADPMPLLLDGLAKAADDKLIPHIVWQNLHPLLAADSAKFIEQLAKHNLSESPALADIMPRAIDRMLSSDHVDLASVAEIFAMLTARNPINVGAASSCLAILAERVESGEIDADELAALKSKLDKPIGNILTVGPDSPLYLPAASLAATWTDSRALAAVGTIFADVRQRPQSRLRALNALIAAGSDRMLPLVTAALDDVKQNPADFRGNVLSALGQVGSDDVAPLVLERFDRFEAELKPRAIEVLTQRSSWSKQLVGAVAAGKLPASAINVNQIRKLLAVDDEELTATVHKLWGNIRTDRDPAREALIGDMRKLVRSGQGDPLAGKAVFTKLCGQCHKMHGEGFDVGPDITSNGRGSFEQLLSNVFDPSLVIGASYQARTVLTDDGRVLTGLLVEDNDQRIVLKGQGGKLETIARDDVDAVKVSPLSLMPEGIEKQLKPEEIVNLFAYLTLDKPPSDPTARLIPGTTPPRPRDEYDSQKYPEVFADTLPGWSTVKSGEGGLAVIGEHFGRPNVLRTHPVERGAPCVLTRIVDIPEGKKAKLLLAVGHHPGCDWKLIVRAAGATLYEGIVGPQTAKNGWLELTVDLSSLAGKPTRLEMLNQPTEWSGEWGYWGAAEVVVE